MNLKEFTDYCLAITAQAAAEPAASPVLDADMVVEFLLPAVLRTATRNAYRNSRYLQSLVKRHAVVLAGGAADLPAGLEEEFADSFQIGKTASGATMLFSLYRDYGDFLDDSGDVLPKFCVFGNKIYFKEANNVAIGDGATMYVCGVTVPQVPADETTAFDIADHVLDDALAVTSSVLRGERPLASVGVTEAMLSK